MCVVDWTREKPISLFPLLETRTPKYVCSDTHPRAVSDFMFFNLTDISLHVRFSMRSELGMVFFCLLYNLHICVPRGSIFAISSGLSRSAPPVSSLQLGKTAFCRTSFCAFCFSGERSRLKLGEWYVASGGGCWF